MTAPPTMPPSPSITLIAALTPASGLGHKGALPWPALKKEMAYFARVTRRAPTPKHINAVIMGRRTWESIPLKFRPLGGRVNVVLTRDAGKGELGVEGKEGEGKGEGRVEGPLVAGSIGQAVERLRNARLGSKGELEVGKVFVIGGAEVYSRALEMEEADRLLLTRIKREFECDVFFPLRFTGDGEEEGGENVTGARWVRASKEELDRWTGEEVPGGVQSENGIEWEFEMWEKKSISVDGG